MSDPAPERRPRPQYGQYASPEEQRARRGIPEPAAAPPLPEHPQPAPAPAAPAAARTPMGRVLDRAAAVALLVYGAIGIVQAIPTYLDATALLRATGVTVELSDPAGARTWGVIAIVVLALGWVGTAALTWRRARTGRLVFWLPLLGGVVFNVLAAILVVIPLVSDPAVAQAIIELQRD